MRNTEIDVTGDVPPEKQFVIEEMQAGLPATDSNGRISAGPPEKIRVLLVDDHAVFRTGLADLLQQEPDIEVVAEASDGETAVVAALRNRPQVVLMDVAMPRLDGIEATRRITATLPGVRVIGLSGHEDDNMAAAMRQAGAAMYLLKDSSPEALVAAIRTTSWGPAADGAEGAS